MSDFGLIHSLGGVLYSDPMGPSFAEWVCGKEFQLPAWVSGEEFQLPSKVFKGVCGEMQSLRIVHGDEFQLPSWYSTDCL